MIRWTRDELDSELKIVWPEHLHIGRRHSGARQGYAEPVEYGLKLLNQIWQWRGGDVAFQKYGGLHLVCIFPNHDNIDPDYYANIMG
ncbi:hypothetical protein [Rhizobium sp. X9]|nr:hypothetical protein [Rhizobium sp. X9]